MDRAMNRIRDPTSKSGIESGIDHECKPGNESGIEPGMETGIDPGNEIESRIGSSTEAADHESKQKSNPDAATNRTKKRDGESNHVWIQAGIASGTESRIEL